ncbi:hypothetical protein AT864_01993 [Anoxybacillus sp. P3H1B]|nr:hypothetical protein AT864_01993 [Anoxybacillus sp. P3H1B]MBB3908393.1 hypothetical protein [Anoxybacillus rupiensis]
MHFAYAQSAFLFANPAGQTNKGEDGKDEFATCGRSTRSSAQG